VIERLDELVIKAAYPSFSFEPVFGRDVQGSARDALIMRLRTQAHAYVAQEVITLSQAPVVSLEDDKKLVGRSVALRLFATATGTADDSYTVMSGGLTRLANQAAAQLISMQRGGGSKDTWVLSERPVSTLSLLKRATTARDLVRNPAALSSRVVENLFWLGRYTTRGDNAARLLRVALSRFDDASRDAPLAREVVLDVCRWLALVPNPRADEIDAFTPQDAEQILIAAVFDTKQASSLASNLRHLMWAATQVRERLSLDNWSTLNRMERSLAASAAKATGRAGLTEALRSLDQIMVFSASLAGFAMDCMTRDDGWRLLIIGRHIERITFLASTISRFLSTLAETLDAKPEYLGSLDWLLETADSIITYRHRYRAQPELLPVLDLIVFDDTNPHGIVLQMSQLISYLNELSDNLGQDQIETTGVLSAQLKLLGGFDLSRFENRFENASPAACRGLARLLNEITRNAWALSDQLAMRHFTHIGDISQQTLAA
jgi:uncharacterized alpha-E superfamily protein